MRKLFLLAALCACQRTTAAPPSAGGADDADRRELVLQPMGAWTPENVPLKLNIQLIPEKDALAAGGKFRYRIESRNVGRDPIVFKEPPPSFIKDGSLCGTSGFRFLMTTPDGEERPMPCDPSVKASAGSGLDLTLGSGEYLLTRAEAPASRFRELRTAFHFDKPGSYRIKAVYSAPGLRAESNTFTFAVHKLSKSKPPVARSSQPENSIPEGE